MAAGVEGGHAARGGDANDGCAGSLQVLRIVEIRHQDVAGVNSAARLDVLRYDDDSVRVDVAIRWNGRHGGWKERKDALRRRDGGGEKSDGGNGRRYRHEALHSFSPYTSDGKLARRACARGA